MNRLRSWEEFNRWAISMYTESLKSDRYSVFSNGKDVIIMTDTKRRGKIGWARKLPNDPLDKRIGIGIAYARLKGIPIPEVIEYEIINSLSLLKNGDKFYITDVYSNLNEYYLIGYDCMNDSYLAVNGDTGVRREFPSTYCRNFLVEKEK